MKSRRAHPTLLAALLSVPLSACTAPTVVEVERATPQHQAITDEFVVFENASNLAEAIVLLSINRNPEEVPPVVQFNIRNLSDEPYYFMYRCRWLDEYGIEIAASNDVWIRKTIDGGARMSLPCRAPNNAATDYRLVMKTWTR